jgi:hypothetical protein
MSEELAEIQRSLGRVEAHLETLVGNGKPGLIQEMRDDIDSLKETRSNTKGYVAGFAGATVIGEGLFHYIMHRVGLK